jgi:hypothetical protein
MPWSGGSFTRTNGVHTGSTLWVQDRDAGTKILATRHDTHDQDLADGINATLEKSGSNAATGNLDIGSNRLTLVADGTAKTDAATVNQIQSNAPAFQATDTGTANAHVIALSPAITAYAAGQKVTFKSGSASTGASTLNVNTLGVKALKKMHDQDISSDDIESGSIVTAVYDGTNFQVTSQLASEPADAGAAYAGVLQANANFVDQVIFGPSIDGTAWNGAWSKAGVYSSLMLATIEDEGANTEINIWDLTEQTAGVISTTPLATVDLSAAATPTSIAAAMGYLIVGSEDGIAIIDPHSGAWAERTTGWPRTLSTSTFPALSANTVIDVGAGFSQQSAHDPRTGGSMPTFAVAYSGGSQASSVIKDDGVVYDRTGTGHVAKIGGGDAYVNLADILYQAGPIDSITADAFQLSQLNASGSSPFGLNCDTAFDIYGDSAASADASGLTLHKINLRNTHGYSNYPLNAIVTRAYNSGYYTSDVRGLWIANSNTVDRSYKGNTLTNNGTVPTATVGELTVYGPFSTSNYLSRASDADWDVLGTGNVHMSCWFETASAVTSETMMGFSNSGGTIRCSITFESHAGNIGWEIQGATATGTLNSALTGLDDGVWHKCDLVQISSTERYIYVDGVKTGVSAGSETTDIGSLSSSGNLPFAIGRQGGQAIQPGASVQLALAHLSATAPSASQVRQMYDGEKGMFVADSECLLQSGSTDAVLDVNVDPLSGKVLVTQTDAITIFDGLVVDSKPTVNSGASEKGKLWGALRAEQNSANAYVTAPATDQRQVNEMVRGLASDLPAGVDLSKAGAWCFYSQSSGATITSSYNIESIADTATGKANFVYSVPFKTDDTAVIGTTDDGFFAPTTITPTGVQGRTYSHAGSLQDNGQTSFVVFGELANE